MVRIKRLLREQGAYAAFFRAYLFSEVRRPSSFRSTAEASNWEAAEVFKPAVVAVEAAAAMAGCRLRAAESRAAEAIMLTLGSSRRVDEAGVQVC